MTIQPQVGEKKKKHYKSRRQRTLRAIALALAAAAFMSFVFFALHARGILHGTAQEMPADTSAAVAADNGSVRLTMIFGGDIMQHMPQITAARRDTTFDYSACFCHLKPIFDTADLVMVNLEATLSDTGPYSGYPFFRAPAQLASALAGCGVDAVMLANNHICDNGADGIRSTIDALTKAGLKYTGAFADSIRYGSHNPLFIEMKGIRLAILNYTYGTNGIPAPPGMIVNRIDTVRIDADLAKIDRGKTDHIIAFFHWGVEYARRPGKEQRELAEWCNRRGVRFVIGSHPHVVQPVELLRGGSGNVEGVTAYSLGNMVSNQRMRYSDGGILLKTEITHFDGDSVAVAAGYIPIWVCMRQTDGRRDYEILPPNIADTLPEAYPDEKYAYSLFISDTRELMGRDTLVREIRP